MGKSPIKAKGKINDEGVGLSTSPHQCVAQSSNKISFLKGFRLEYVSNTAALVPQDSSAPEHQHHLMQNTDASYLFKLHSSL